MHSTVYFVTNLSLLICIKPKYQNDPEVQIKIPPYGPKSGNALNGEQQK